MDLDNKIKQEAEKFARENKKKIAKQILDGYVSVSDLTSFFMAGSPGAGKTEMSVNFVKNSFEANGIKILRVDTDDYRGYFDKYDGTNSDLFQSAASIITEKIYDLVLEQRVNFIMDGTMANLDKAKLNIERSLQKRRKVVIFYIHQSPVVAWEFTKARERVEGRKISQEVFINGYLNSRENIKELKKVFGDRITILLIYKNYLNDSVEKVDELLSVEKFELGFEKWYNREELLNLIN